MEIKIINSSETRSNVCIHCNEPHSTELDLKNHLSSCLKTEIQCSVCQKVFSDDKSALKHFDSHLQSENVKRIKDRSEDSKENLVTKNIIHNIEELATSKELKNSSKKFQYESKD